MNDLFSMPPEGHELTPYETFQLERYGNYYREDSHDDDTDHAAAHDRYFRAHEFFNQTNLY